MPQYPSYIVHGNIRIPAEYRSDVTYGADVKALAVSLYSEGVMSNDRIASFLNAAGNGELGLSEGSVYGLCRSFAKVSETSAMGSKSIEALKEQDFLKQYAGILLHDHETALYHFGTDHAECNVHIIRYLRKNTEETENAKTPWDRVHVHCTVT